MKTLEEYNLIRDFLGGQNLQPTVAMVCVKDSEWADLKFLAREWKTARGEERAKAEEAEANLSEDELALRDKQAREEALLENDRVLFHSCGSRPEKKHV